MYNLFIDDERIPADVTWTDYKTRIKYKSEEWVIARSFKEVKSVISEFGFPDFISFDHDLGYNQQTGYIICQWLCDLIMDEKYQFPENFEFFVNSKNPVGAKNIQTYMNNFIEHWKE